MNTTPQPTDIQRTDDRALLITWSDGVVRRYKVRELRDKCPCATCREKRDAPAEDAPLLPILSPAEIAPLEVAGMRPVGNYAYGIHFSDGHDTGIYTFNLLRELGVQEDA